MERKRFMDEERPEVEVGHESTDPALGYKDLQDGLAKAENRLGGEEDAQRRAEIESEITQIKTRQEEIMNRVRGRKMLDKLELLVKQVIAESRGGRLPNTQVLDLLKKELNTGSDDLKALKGDYYEGQVYSYVITPATAAEIKTEATVEEQIRQLAEQMSKLEALGISYNEMHSQPEYVNLQTRVRQLSLEAQHYYGARQKLYEAGRFVPTAGGTIDDFTQLGKLAGGMRIIDIILQQKEVSSALSEFEVKSRQIEWVEEQKPNGTTKRVVNGNKNPAFSSPTQLEIIRKEIAKKIAVDSVKEHFELESGDVGYEEALATEETVQMGAVTQAETIWRMWMRSALSSGLVFKEGTDPEIVKRLSFLGPLFLVSHWEEYGQHLDWDQSFEGGTTESAVQRLLYAGLFHKKNQQGEERMRPYLQYGTRDFLSSFLNKDFLEDSKNFRKGPGFVMRSEVRTVEDLKGKNVKLLDKIFEKFGEDGRVIERVIIHPNGVLEVDAAAPFNFANVRWMAKGEDAYTGLFTVQNLIVADKARDAMMSPDKLARDPGLGALHELRGGMERFESVQKDIEKEELKIGHSLTEQEVEDLLDKKREEDGKVYREDMYMLLGLGVLDFQMHDMERKYGVPNIIWSQVDYAIDSLRTRNMVTKRQAQTMKRMAMAVSLGDKVNLPILMQDFIRSAVITTHRINPGSVFMAMLGEFFKQVGSQK
ncbi:hypothetical protein A3A14_02990 [Candidatus Daviesbacteria bacterium RIFCSPLOWO2_01_FULL_43_38]|nr:MAG: hypothetical protein A2874_03575 [Candidatus Daviesbacteria bacterium RIFCSPHIGHO2_01_FULL_43_17]OGE63595.1 MAG: hypothetical protein A3A14_02990 [Candidatus Daviesbacteria bacterium RIFCSPLOWO2_01_FULL_43_38]OGE69214.1 MAG: hypothetical protein A3J21_01675 [Candidatus Daviesbacteria bacterium RIFCSPLOWO2_02_FULL_43_11]